MLKYQGLELVIDPKSFAFYTGVDFRGLTVSERGTGWIIILRATKRNGDKVYAAWETDDLVDGFDQFLDALTDSHTRIGWHTDKYAK